MGVPVDARLIWLAVAGVVAAIFIATTAGRPRRPLRVLLVGDSLAVGLTAPLRADLTRAGARFHAESQGGSSAALWRSRLPALVAAHHPDLVLVSVGANDCRREDSPACVAFRDRTRDLVAIAEGAGARMLFLLPDWLTWSSVIADALDESAAAMYPAVPVPVQPDRVHPTAAGYRAWAGDISRRISP